MLIIGLISSREEQKEIHFIAHIWILRQRIHYLAQQADIQENQPIKSTNTAAFKKIKKKKLVTTR